MFSIPELRISQGSPSTIPLAPIRCCPTPLLPLVHERVLYSNNALTYTLYRSIVPDVF